MDLFDDTSSSSSSSSSPPLSAASKGALKATGSPSPPTFRINEEYAKRFQHNKERTELHRLQERYGTNVDGEGYASDATSSSDETEDDDGEQITPDVDAAILRTLAKIRHKHDSIYDVDKRVFDEERAQALAMSSLPKRIATAQHSKRITLADYQRSRLQEVMSTSKDPAAALADATTAETRRISNDDYDNDVSAAVLPPAAEAELLRRQVTAAFHSNVEDDDADDDEQFFTLQNGDNGQDDDIESYRRFLLGALGDADGEKLRELLRAQIEDGERGDAELVRTAEAAEARRKKEKAAKKQREKNAKSEAATSDSTTKDTEKANEDFLVNYILNRGWIDTPNSAPRPSHPRNVAKVKRSATVADDAADEEGADVVGRNWDAEAAELSSEGSFDSRAEAYETAYNFRFEALEAGDASEQIQSYARNPEGTARRTEEKRKREREARKAKKAEEKSNKMTDLKRLADLKRKDIVERLKQLKEMTGSSAIDFETFDLDADFDPDAHDHVMKQAFSDNYYQERDTEMNDEDEDGRPVWEDDIDIDDIIQANAPSSSKGVRRDVKGKAKAQNVNANNEDGPIEMDADFLDGGEANLAGNTGLSKKERKKLKKKIKAAEKKVVKRNVGDLDGEGVAIDEMDASKVLAAPTGSATSKDDRKRKLNEAMDEYYNLGYEDVVGDQPTRFKYTPVQKSSYGLTPVEILLADDKELNNVVGLRHIQPYRRGGNKKPVDLNRRLREFRESFAKKLSEFASDSEARFFSSDGAPKAKRAGKKERKKRKIAERDFDTGAAAALTAPNAKSGNAWEHERHGATQSVAMEDGQGRDDDALV